MRPKKMLEVIEESVKSDAPIGNLPELVAAAEATRAELSEEFGDAKVLCNALQWFAWLDPNHGSIADVDEVMRQNLTEIIENPHSGRVRTKEAIAAAMWFAEHTEADDRFRYMCQRAAIAGKLSFARDPDIHVYTE